MKTQKSVRSRRPACFARATRDNAVFPVPRRTSACPKVVGGIEWNKRIRTERLGRFLPHLRHGPFVLGRRTADSQPSGT